MAWKVKQSPVVKSMTRELAREFMEMQAAPHDRPMRDRRIEFLSQQITNGQFRTCSWASCYCKEDGKTYRVNGKHTSNIFAVVQPVPRGIKVCIERYEADTLQDVAALYSTFDTRSSVRSTSDINAAYAATVPQYVADNVPLRKISLAVSGMSYATWGNSEAGVAPDVRAQMMTHNVQFVRFVAELTAGQENNWLCRAAVVAAMYQSWLRSRETCQSFWEQVKDGAGLRKWSPQLMLRNYLIATSARTGLVHNSRRTADRASMFGKCINAWNAHRDGVAQLKCLKYVAGKDRPRAL